MQNRERGHIIVQTQELLPGGSAVRILGIRGKLYRITYDKPRMNKKVMQFHNSMDELKKLLGGHGSKAKK